MVHEYVRSAIAVLLFCALLLSNVVANAATQDEERRFKAEQKLTSAILLKNDVYEAFEKAGLSGRTRYDRFRTFLDGAADCQWRALRFADPRLRRKQIDVIMRGGDMLEATKAANRVASKLQRSGAMSSQELGQSVQMAEKYLDKCVNRLWSQLGLY